MSTPRASGASRRQQGATTLAEPVTSLLFVPAPAPTCEFMARLHREVLPLGFFGGLGSRFLRRYYETFVLSPHAVTIVATQHEQPVGFVVGTLRPSEHLRWTLNKLGPGLAVAGAVALLVRPLLCLQFLRTRAPRYWRAIQRHVLKPAESLQQDQPAYEPTAVLWHVAVDPLKRETGIGRMLVEAFLTSARTARRTRAILVTRQDTGASAFYERLGWRQAGIRYDDDGNRLLLFEVEL